MNISGKQAIEVLSEMGLDVVLVEDDNKEFKNDDAVNSITDFLKPEIAKVTLSEEEPKLHAKFLGSLRSAVTRAYGIKREDLEKLELKEIIDLAKEKNPANTDEWKSKYEQLVKDYEAADEEKNAKAAEKEQEWAGKLAASEKKFADRDIDSGIVALLNKVPRKGGDINEQADTLRFKAEKAGYEIKYNNGSIEFWKDNRKHKTEDVINPIIEKNFPIAKDTSHVDPAKVRAGQETGVDTGIKNVPAGMEKIAAWASEEAA